METLEKSRMCRLCGKNSGIAIDIFDKNENHVRKINAILPILVHEMDLLPKQMCHRCSYKLEEFYNFYVECAKTDTELKSQLSWMRKENLEEKIITPMVKVNRFKIKTEPPDYNDSGDSNDVFGKINENSLVFPASILHSYDFDSPMLTCSRCRCICNGNINISKQSPKEVKELSKEIERQPHCSDMIPDVSKKSDGSSNKSSGSNNVNENSNANKSIIEIDNFKEKSIQETPVVNLINGNPNKPTKVNGIKILKTENLNRALRPRKGSVDYMGQKKKDLASNIKTKLKSKLDMLSPSVVTPANMKITQTSMINQGPIIKLEKVDDTMKSLRVRKNLEEFNRRIKEYQRKKNQESINESHRSSRRHFHKDSIFSNKRPEDEDQLRKYLRREEKQRRKSLHKVENIVGKTIFTDNVSRKNIKNDENSNQKSVCEEQNESEKSVFSDIDLKNKSFRKDEGSSQKSLERNESTITKSLQREKTEGEKTLQNEKNQANNKNTSENVRNVMELEIKQETLSMITQSNEPPEIEILQEKTYEVEISKEVREVKSEDRFTFNAIVKLEKDYTCNVDYPRIKIKRHLPVSNSSGTENNVLEVGSSERHKVHLVTNNRKSLNKNDGNISPKHLRSEDRKLRNFKDKNKLRKVLKTKRKGMGIVKVKRKVLEKGSAGSASQTDVIKFYCEECDTSFRNKELYKLHPCYQN